MAKRVVVPMIAVIAVLMFSPLTRAQDEIRRWPGAVYDSDFKGRKSSPAPRRDLSGIWEPAKDAADAIAFTGAKAMPEDGKPEHEPPYTPEGLAAFMANKPTAGATMVDSALNNDSYWRYCDPQGYPRIVLHNFRESQILQTPNQVVILYMFNERWRVIWTDGRELPKDFENPGWTTVAGVVPPPPEPRWWGYSIGKWVDDYTFVDVSTGFHDGTWLDNAGRPHSDALEVEETYHRVDADHLELSIKITDPKMYAKPWVALDKLSLRLQSPHLDVYASEMECAGSETRKYEQMFADPAAAGDPGRR
jgi:hypothetical protein